MEQKPSTDHMGTALNVLKEAVFVYDEKMVIKRFNRAAEKITGFSKDEVIGKKCVTLFKTNICLGNCDLCMVAKKSQDLIRFESAFYRKDAQKRFGEFNVGLLKKDAKGQLEVLVSLTDITEIVELRDALKERASFHKIIGQSLPMKELYQNVKNTAYFDSTVLLQGETGTGKELIVEAIHFESLRHKKKLVKVNCASFSDTLLESELFGHEKGAFTGAVADKKGRFEIADKGTIFLDEIGEVSENFQVKLLRVIQAGDYEKVGSSTPSHTDVRIVAATNKDLEKLVKENKFREDLFYRLNVIKILIPPLRKRKEDIIAIANEFLSKESHGLKMSAAFANALTGNDWKGNIRELQAILKRAAIFAKAAGRNLIQLSDLPPEMVKAVKISFDELVIESLREKHFSYSSVSDTAKELGDVSRTVVSENFRGYAFKCFVENNFNFDLTVETISGLNNKDSIEAVKNKLKLFLDNLKSDIESSGLTEFDEMKKKFKSKYKNLPQKFHVYLDEVIKHLMK